MNSLFINIAMFLAVFLAIIYIVFKRDNYIKELRQKAKNIYKKVFESSFSAKMQSLILSLEMQKIINKKVKIITPTVVAILSVLLSIIAYIFFYNVLKVKSTAFILSVPTIIAPTLILNFLLSKQKNKILENFPTYLVNLKNSINNGRDIIYAIQITKVVEPLDMYVNKFNIRIKRGVNIHEAFEKLKQEIGIKKINGFIAACQICHSNGGDFTGILNQFSSIITKENIQKEKLKENSYSSIITLAVMLLMNLYLIFFFVFKNKEYAEIIRNTFGGVVILNFTAITYIIIGYLILKIYKMGEE